MSDDWLDEIEPRLGKSYIYRVLLNWGRTKLASWYKMEQAWNAFCIWAYIALFWAEMGNIGKRSNDESTTTLYTRNDIPGTRY